MSTAPDSRFTIAQAIQIQEAVPEIRMELIDGTLVAMGPARPWHGVFGASLIAALHRQIPRPCRVLTASIGVGVDEAEPTYLHPDATVVCGGPEVMKDNGLILTNARAVFEVASPGTARRDRGIKRAKYMRCPKMELIVLFEHEERRATVWTRAEEAWTESDVRTGQRIQHAPLNLDLSLDALYDEAATFDGP